LASVASRHQIFALMSDLTFALLGFVAWGVACWLGLAFVTVPLALFAISAGLVYGAALTVGGYVQVYWGSKDRWALIRPDAESPRRPSAPYPYWDDAWPSYLSGQVERDIMAAAAWPSRQAHDLWAEGIELAVSSGPILLVFLPLAPEPFVFLVGVSAGTYGGWTALAAAIEVVMAISRGARLSAIGVLRAADSMARWWHGAAVTCPACRYVAWLPAYQCDEGKDDTNKADARKDDTGEDETRKCDTIHRDLRPGRLGVWIHRCQCGKALPTTVRRAGRALTPVCSNCSSPLYEQAGLVPDARIALSGGSGVGKTQLLMRAATEMTSQSRPAPWEPGDDQTTAWLRHARRLLRQWPEFGPEPTKEPALLTFRRSVYGQQYYFHTSDLDGRHFESDKDNPALWQLGVTRRHLLVLDATVVPRVRDRIGLDASGGTTPRPAWTETSIATAERPYRLLVAQLGRLGARPHKCSLAVVVTKADILARHGADPGGLGLRAWLRSAELHNLVMAAEHDFGRVRYFLVGEGQENSAEPFEWLLSQYPRGAATP
jgi:hypothetical protein